MRLLKKSVLGTVAFACLLACTDRKKYVAEMAAKFYERSQDLLKTCKAEAEYPGKAELEKKLEQSRDKDFTKAELEAWLKLFPTKEYYDEFARVSQTCSAQFDQLMNEVLANIKHKDKLLEIYARLAKQSFVIGVASRFGLLGVDLVRATQMLENSSIWTNRSEAELAARTKDYLCATTPTALEAKFKSAILKNARIAALLHSNFDTSETEKAITDYRARGKAVFEAPEPECSKFVLLFTDRCLTDSIEKQMAIWDQEKAITHELDAKLATSLCANAENIK